MMTGGVWTRAGSGPAAVAAAGMRQSSEMVMVGDARVCCVCERETYLGLVNSLRTYRFPMVTLPTRCTNGQPIIRWSPTGHHLPLHPAIDPSTTTPSAAAHTLSYPLDPASRQACGGGQDHHSGDHLRQAADKKWSVVDRTRTADV
eukprot:SAG22_NODE_6307_length_872_cov_1.245796_1_plen_145_part_10